MLVNYVAGEECRIAIVRDNRLEEFYQERASAESHVGNIYKGRVTNVEPSIQAAFIDFGIDRNGFLHISDLHPMYFPGQDREEFERVGSKTPHRERPPIQKCLRRGQEVLVQVLKEGIGTKGPTLTSYLSIPGRFLVMMPHMQRLGVSRKVEDDDARREARKLLDQLDPPGDFGFIIRTAGIGQTKTDLKRDLAYLQRLWRNIDAKRKKIGKTGELYTESDLVIRTIRDVFTTDIKRVIVDEPTAARRAYDFLNVASPRSRSKVLYYDSPVPLFHRFGIEKQIEDIHSREVPLPSGGSLVFDQTEALVAVDVNSGKSRDARDAEANAYNTNKEAIVEIARQLRLRDLGGVVVLDLIDMRDRKNRRSIEQQFRKAIKDDRARSRIGSISQFGILELTRQRMRPSLKSSIYQTCTHCNGMGQVKSPESVVLDVMRRLALTMHEPRVARLELVISPDVAFRVLNQKRLHLARLEQSSGKPVTVRVGGSSIDHVHIAAYDARGGEIDVEQLMAKSRPQAAEQALQEMSGELLPGEQVQEDEQEAIEQETEQVHAEAAAEAEAETEAGEDEDAAQKKRRRRRRRGGRRTRKGRDPQAEGDEPGTEQAEAAQGDAAEPAEQDAGEASRDESAEDGQAKKPRKRSRRSRKKASSGSEQAGGEQSGSEQGEAKPSDAAEPSDVAEPVAAQASGQDGAAGSENGSGGRKKRRRRGSRTRQGEGEPASSNGRAEAESGSEPAGAAGDAGSDAADTEPAGEQAKAEQPSRQRKKSSKRSTAGRTRKKKAAPSKGGAEAEPSQGDGAGAEASSDATPAPAGSGYSNRLVKRDQDEQA